MAVTFEHVEVFGGHGQDATTIQIPPHGTLGGPEAGDLMMILVGSRSQGAGVGTTASIDGWTEENATGNGASFQTTILSKVADDTDAGKQIVVNAPDNEACAIQYLRFSKESEQMAWRINTNRMVSNNEDNWRVTVPDVTLTVSGLIVAFNFIDQGSQLFWNEYSEYNNALGGYPQEITRGSSTSGRGYHRRVSLMDVDGLQGVGPGEDGLPEVIGDVDPPTAPTNLVVVSKTHSTVTFRWEPSTTDGLISEYRIFQGAEHIKTVNGVTLRTTVKGLTPNSNYSFRVRAFDVLEQLSPMSDYLQMKTDKAPEEPEEEEQEPEPNRSPSTPDPPGRITNIVLGGRSERGIRWYWNTPEGGPVDRYKTYRSDNVTGTRLHHTSRERRFGGLKEGKRYGFGFRAEGPGGIGPWTYKYATTKSKPKPKRYSKTFSSTWSQAYRSNGGKHTGGNYLFHGYGDSFNGNGRSLIGFNDSAIRRYLKGAKILDIYFVVYIHRTWWNSGGRFRYGYHTRSNQPSSWSSGMVSMRGTSGNVKAGQTVKIGLTNSVGRAFQDGKARGIAIGPASSNSTKYYIHFKTYAKLVIKYEK